MQADAVNLPSPERRRAALSLFGALGAGTVTQSLFWGARLGANLLVFDVLYVAATLLVLRRGRVTAAAMAAATGIVALGAAVAWYASDWALWVAFPGNIALLAALPFLVSHRIGPLSIATLPRVMLDGSRAVPDAVGAAVRLPRVALDVSGRKVAAHLARGLLLGLPVAAVFVVLLSADHNFSDALERGIGGSSTAILLALACIATGAAFLVGYLLLARAREGEGATAAVAQTPYRFAGVAAVATEPAAALATRPPRVRPLTWAVVLTQLVAVFAVFVATNFRTLFGGDALVHARGTPTYAQYLHTGFAELSAATLLAVVAVVAGHRLVRERSAVGTAGPIPGGRGLAALEGTLLALAGVTLISCFQRLLIYEDAYGATYLRLGVGFFQLGVAGLLVVTLAKAVARSWRGWAACTLALAFGLVVGAGCIDADRWVAQANVARAERGRPLDYDYLASLGPDAAGALDEAVVQNDWGGLEMLVESWDAQRAELRAGDWRSRRGLRLGR